MVSSSSYSRLHTLSQFFSASYTPFHKFQKLNLAPQPKKLTVVEPASPPPVAPPRPTVTVKLSPVEAGAAPLDVPAFDPLPPVKRTVDDSPDHYQYDPLPPERNGGAIPSRIGGPKPFTPPQISIPAPPLEYAPKTPPVDILI